MKDYDQIALDIARNHTPEDDAQARAALQVDIANALNSAARDGREATRKIIEAHCKTLKAQDLVAAESAHG